MLFTQDLKQVTPCLIFLFYSLKEIKFYFFKQTQVDACAINCAQLVYLERLLVHWPSAKFDFVRTTYSVKILNVSKHLM